MSLDSATMKASIKSEILAHITIASDSDGTLDKYCAALADAIVTRIKADLSIKIPINSAIVAVTPPAAGVMNLTTIDCAVA